MCITAPVARQASSPVRWASMALLLTALLATGACGFKLRGQVQIPPQLNPLFIEPARGSPVRNAILRQLQGSQVRLAASPQQARVILRLADESRSSRVIAVDANGKILASELHYGLSFDALTPAGEQLVSQRRIDVVRGYDNPNVEVLGKQLEGELIYREMIEDAANRVLNRLRGALL